jgi:hypothetical protein
VVILSDAPPITGVKHKLETLLPLAIVAAVVLGSAALAAPSGNYKGKIEYQGYDVTFRVSKNGKRVTDLVARMPVDCDGDGYSQNFLIAPQGSWPIKTARCPASAHRLRHARAAVHREAAPTRRPYSHSIVPGGFDVMSSVTRFT